MAASLCSGETLSEGQAQTFPNGMLPNPPACLLPSRDSTSTSTLRRSDFSMTRPPNFSGARKGKVSTAHAALLMQMSVAFDISSKLLESRRSLARQEQPLLEPGELERR